MIDFFQPGKYLKQGNPRQRRAWQDLESFNLLSVLQPFQPVLVGTIPIEIDVEGSDLDIICCASDLDDFATLLTRHFGHCTGFRLERGITRNEIFVVAHFQANHFPVEIFGQSRPVVEQNAYRHMIVEYRLLQEKGEDFRQAILSLKESGVKTEPAFAQVLGLKGDPYEALLNL